MKVTEIRLERYKRFTDYTMSFRHEETGRPLDLVLLVGENGSGKSSILQAIAATLGVATGQITSLQQFNWPGFVYESISDGYRGFSRVQVSIEFTPDELSATSDYFEQSGFNTTDTAVPPGNQPLVTLELKNAPHSRPVSAPSASQYYQFRGREYAYKLLRSPNRQPDIFERIGAIFWYHEQ
ncbi:MAG: AAA family ATPase, partial [bacterium]|nr:AAA family ATPase [bacterium]